MTTPEAARAALEQAQSTYEQCVADLAKLTETTTWLGEITARARALFDYYGDEGQKDIATVLADQPAAVTPMVADEDAVWELMAGYDDAMMRLLRLVTAEVTSGLDDPNRC